MTGDLEHGGAIDQMRFAFPNAPGPWIDLSTGINPWPYPATELAQASLQHLPTLQLYHACRDAMAASIGAKPDALLLSPGSELIIRLLPDVLQTRRIAILTPTYADHASSWARAGADIVRAEDPLECIDAADAIVICHPNNPDGRCFDLEALEWARKKLAARGGWLIVDEAYADLIPDLSLAPKGGEEGLIILRSFGKFYGLAGLRLGGVLAPSIILEAIAKRLGVWPVSGAALEIGARAYADMAWQLAARKKLSIAARQLDTALESVGLSVVGGTDLFRLVEVDDAHADFRRLAEAGIYVRRFDWSETHLRIGLPKNLEAQDRLHEALSL
ncbi:MAG: threonine-phosphate decarboxylase CobD [Pseudomonadota bacterium]